uniref:N-acetyltransferase domain-containing protein n=1 Tax=uncultured Nocardioidaceae bacterium TaxID=253824 RepID=A0A6J4KND8_9ACTN|nr:MAG: hypothetical protein AVDCRST_MAG46-130 [uncultured Nocardioidaceae bacterium]
MKQLTGDDWRNLRLVRLSALADSPSAFGSRLEEEERLDDTDWRKWADSGSVFIASENGSPVGMVAALDGDSPAERRLVALWVHPDHRAHGVASALIWHVEDWARRQGADRLTLWVAHSNEAARRLYLLRGYKNTGNRKSLPSDPAVEEDQMWLALC